MAYEITFKKSVSKDVRRIPQVVLKRIKETIKGLEIEPHPGQAVKIQGYDNYFRVRIGDYRIVYVVDAKRRLVVIITIRHRKDVYKIL